MSRVRLLQQMPTGHFNRQLIRNLQTATLNSTIKAHYCPRIENRQ